VPGDDVVAGGPMESPFRKSPTTSSRWLFPAARRRRSKEKGREKRGEEVVREAPGRLRRGRAIGWLLLCDHRWADGRPRDVLRGAKAAGEILREAPRRSWLAGC
jgi:hypothetical protein